MPNEQSNKNQEDIDRELILKCARDIYENPDVASFYENLPCKKDTWELTKELGEFCRKIDHVIDVSCDSEFELGYSTSVFSLLDYTVDHNEKLKYAVELSCLARLGRSHWLKQEYIEGFANVDGTLIPMGVRYSGVVSKEASAIEQVVSNAAMNKGYKLFSDKTFDFVLPFKFNNTYQKLYDIKTETMTANMFFFGI